MSEITAEEYAAAQAAEYGKYVAVAPIFIGGARAFNPGFQVPISHIEPDDKFGLLADGLVEIAEGYVDPAGKPAAPSTPPAVVTASSPASEG